ncbi:hypothetical protein ACQKQC_24480, partial [Vibrio fortis]|uniref:hypothetical protein n=1 Tax=Vibrio fortis TaxID=212667 RepID=UPI0040694E79
QRHGVHPGGDTNGRQHQRHHGGCGGGRSDRCGGQYQYGGNPKHTGGRYGGTDSQLSKRAIEWYLQSQRLPRLYR